MKRGEERNRRKAAGQGGELGSVFESAHVDPTPDERRRLLAAAEPILAGHREAARRATPAGRTGARGESASWTDRLRVLFTPRRVVAAAFTAAAVAAVVLHPWPPPVRATRSAAVVTWAEHEQPDPARPFPLATASFGRPY